MTSSARQTNSYLIIVFTAHTHTNTLSIVDFNDFYLILIKASRVTKHFITSCCAGDLMTVVVIVFDVFCVCASSYGGLILPKLK